VVSPLLLAELEDVLGRKKFSRITADETRRFVADIRSRAEVVPDAPEPWLAETRDPKDDYLVAFAREAGVDALVSGDVHLTELVDLLPPVMTPAAFLARVVADAK
jgi:putative PIN family toxin of toxin-antitoxin system